MPFYEKLKGPWEGNKKKHIKVNKETLRTCSYSTFTTKYALDNKELHFNYHNCIKRTSSGSCYTRKNRYPLPNKKSPPNNSST